MIHQAQEYKCKFTMIRTYLLKNIFYIQFKPFKTEQQSTGLFQRSLWIIGSVQS